MKQSIHHNLVRGLLAAGVVLLPAVLQAQPSAHYVPGVEGVKGSSLPPPGVYLRDYNVFYTSDRLNDSQGDKISGVNPGAVVYANVPRLLWITELQLFGGNIGVDALLPLKYTELSGPDSTFGVGDVFAEVTWSKHLKKFDFALGYGIWAPTGDANYPTDAGSGFWTHMITAGATWYVDAQKKWAISALNRYEISTENDDAGYTPGQAYTVEWGVSRALSPAVDLGLIGYYQQQVTDDSNRHNNGNHDMVVAVGPEISVFYPKYTLGWSLRYAYEVIAEDRLQGHTAVLTISKRF